MHGSLVARASPICGPPPFRHEHNTALHKRYTISTSMHGLPLRSSIRWSFRAITVGSAAGWPAFHRGVETRARGGERRSTGAQAADARVALRSLLSIAAKNSPGSTSHLSWAFTLCPKPIPLTEIGHCQTRSPFGNDHDLRETASLKDAFQICHVERWLKCYLSVLFYDFHHVSSNREKLFLFWASDVVA